MTNEEQIARLQEELARAVIEIGVLTGVLDRIMAGASGTSAAVASDPDVAAAVAEYVRYLRGEIE